MSILRKFLFPFSLIYGLIIWLRNILYDCGILKSTAFEVPVICVGNLSVGGTGKTPMIEYLLRLLLPQYPTATLSRGYGRSSKGFILLKGDEDASWVGDEPLQFKLKFPGAFIAVDENRQRGILNLLSQASPRVILLDDAFQHRKVRAGLTILLTTFGKLYSKDFILPAGNLREPAVGAKRAQIIIVTKCPFGLKTSDQEEIRDKLNLLSHQQLYFSYIDYAGFLLNDKGRQPMKHLYGKKIGLVTGIANPKPFCEYLEQQKVNFTHLDFPDHHLFTEKELLHFRKFELILTTEKDYMRLKDILKHSQLFYIPIVTRFIKEEDKFRKEILQFILNEK